MTENESHGHEGKLENTSHDGDRIIESWTCKICGLEWKRQYDYEGSYDLDEEPLPDDPDFDFDLKYT